MGVPAALVNDRMSTLVTFERLLAARWMLVPAAAVSVPAATMAALMLESVADVAVMDVVWMLLILESVV